MSESTLSLQHSQFAGEVGHVLNFGRDYNAMDSDKKTEVDSIIARGIRQFLFPPPIGNETSSHSWTFLHPVTTLTTSAPYETGTIAIASGVVTLTGGTWPSWAAQGELTADGSTYAVSSRDSGTQLTLTDTSVTVAAGETYELQRVVYDAPDNFGGMEGGMTYQSNTTGAYVIPVVGEGYVREARSRPGSSGKPQVVAVRPKAAMALTGQRFEFLLWPNADAAYILTYRYTHLIDNIASSTTVYPLGGMAHSETVLASCLDIAHQYLQPQDRPSQSAARQNFLDRLTASVMADRGNMQRDFYGYNADRSDAKFRDCGVGLSHNSDLICSYNGVVYG